MAGSMAADDPAPLMASAKAALRARMRAARIALDPARRLSETAMTVEAMIALLSAEGTAALASYAAHGSELDLTALHRWWIARGLPLWLPRALPAGEISWHAVADLSALAPGAYGIPEPDPARIPAQDLPAHALVLVPGLAFDTVGGRLGQGGGYYDRLPEAVWRRAIGIGFSCQRVASVPREAHDRLLQRIAIGGIIRRPGDNG
jgi:5-formyltetrahydrofolate cyclo-ligase